MNNADKKYAVFFLNTGRCGSQFFASKLAEVYPDLLRVEHEPFHKEYEPRRFFSFFKQNQACQLPDVLDKHFKAIEETLESKHYVETGWPAYGILPHLIQRFSGRVKVVHLYRHPVRVAASMTTHDIYNRGDWTKEMLPTPSDFGVKQSYLAGDSWDKMDDFSKALFWWTELNGFGLELKRECKSVPWMALRFEDAVSSNGNNTLKRLTRFLELPERESFERSAKEKVDRFRRVVNFDCDTQQVEHYQETLDVMQALGYAMSDITPQEIRKRYHSVCPKLINKVLGALRRIKALQVTTLTRNKKGR